MALLDKLRAALAVPAVAATYRDIPFESPWASPNHLLPFAPPEHAHHHLTRHRALSVPALKRARNLIAANIARCPMLAYRGETLVTPQPSFLSRTDGPLSPMHRMLWTIDDLIFYGWSCWAVHRDSENRVIEADRIPFHRWEIRDGVVYYDDAPADENSVILIPGLNEGILDLSADAIEHAITLNRQASRRTKTPAPQVLLKQLDGPPMPDDDIAKLKSDYLAARNSDEGGVAYANRNIDVIEMGKADPSLLIAGRNTAAIETARLMDIPASLLDAGLDGNGGSINYGNADTRNRELIDYALAPYMAAVAARLGLDDVVARGTRIEFDTTTLTGVASDVDVPDDQDGAATPPAPTPLRKV